MSLGIILFSVYLKLFHIYIKKVKLVIKQSYLLVCLNSVSQVILENMYVWNFFNSFVLKNEIFCQKYYKVYHHVITFRF